MKILFVTHYYEPDSGAAANRLTRLAKQLHVRGHQVTVLTTMPHYPKGIIPDAYKGKFTFVENRDGIQIIQVWLYTSSSPKISRRLLSQLSFMITCTLRGIFIKRHDVMFIENQPIFTALAGWIISHIKRTPYLANISDFWPEYLVVAGVTTESSIIYRVFRAIANRTQSDAKAIVTLYPPLLDSIQKRIKKLPATKVIYNSVDLEKFHPDVDDKAFRKKYALDDNKLITFLGVLGNHIDLDTMLKVAQHFASYPNLKFLFVGAGQQQGVLIEALNSAEYAHCISMDWIDYDEVPSFWKATYITYWAVEDNPLDQMRIQAKLYEAMVSGTPAVVAVKGLMNGLLTTSNAGIAVPSGDVNAMIQAIEQLLNDDDYYQTMSQNAHQYAVDNFDLQRNIDDYENMLQLINTEK